MDRQERGHKDIKIVSVSVKITGKKNRYEVQTFREQPDRCTEEKHKSPEGVFHVDEVFSASLMFFNVPDWKGLRYIKNPTSEVVFFRVLLNNVFIDGNLAPFTHLVKRAGLEAASLTG